MTYAFFFQWEYGFIFPSSFVCCRKGSEIHTRESLKFTASVPMSWKFLFRSFSPLTRQIAYPFMLLTHITISLLLYSSKSSGDREGNSVMEVSLLIYCLFWIIPFGKQSKFFVWNSEMPAAQPARCQTCWHSWVHSNRGAAIQVRRKEKEKDLISNKEPN